MYFLCCCGLVNNFWKILKKFLESVCVFFFFFFCFDEQHYGHILAGTIKDVLCRYASQTGHYVERRFGWDTHG